MPGRLSAQVEPTLVTNEIPITAVGVQKPPSIGERSKVQRVDKSQQVSGLAYPLKYPTGGDTSAADLGGAAPARFYA